MDYVLKQGRSRKGLQFVYDTLNGKQESNGVLVDMIMDQAKNLPFWENINNNEKNV